MIFSAHDHNDISKGELADSLLHRTDSEEKLS